MDFAGVLKISLRIFGECPWSISPSLERGTRLLHMAGLVTAQRIYELLIPCSNKKVNVCVYVCSSPASMEERGQENELVHLKTGEKPCRSSPPTEMGV